MQPSHSEKPTLSRTLGKLNLINLGIGGIIGAGIFVLTGQVAAHHAGPAIVLSLVFSGIACVFAGLCYAEFATMLPVSGSVYSYSKVTMGKLFAWIIGWDLILEYLFASATVSVGWSGYVNSFLKDIGIHIPRCLTQSPYIFDPSTGWHATGSFFNLPAVAILTFITTLLVLGIKQSTRFNNLIVWLKLGVIFLFIGFGAKYIHLRNLTPFIPKNTGHFGEFGWSGILRGAGVIFFAYIGFDAVSTAAQESKNPQKDMPIGILGSLAISTVLYILVSIVLVGMVPYAKLGVPDPIAIAVDAAGPALLWLRPFVKLGAIAGLSSVILVMLMGQSRIFYAMAKDRYLPAFFSKIHPTYKTPYITTLISGGIASLVAGLLPIGLLGELVSIGTLLAFVMVCLGIWILRKTKPDLHRPFKTPWVPLVPILGILTAGVQMVALPADTWIRLAVWMGIGMVIYYFYGRHHVQAELSLD